MPIRARLVGLAVCLAALIGTHAEARRAPDPAPPMPCEVSLEHGYLIESAQGGAWAVLRTAVYRLVRPAALLCRDIDWLRGPVAPAPMSLAQALAAPNVAATSRRGAVATVTHTLGDGDATLRSQFDRQGRLTRAELDLVADDSTYVFTYGYRCARTIVLPREGEIPRPVPFVDR